MRILLASPLLAILFIFPARAAEPLGDIYACASLTTDAERLACYDAAVGRLKAAEQAGEVSVVDPVKVRQIEKEAFGFSIPSLPRLALPNLANVLGGGEHAELDQLSFTIERVRSDGLKASFTMSNGQTWRQLDNERVTSFKPGKAVVIRRAAMGSFLMKLEQGASNSIRVKREE